MLYFPASEIYQPAVGHSLLGTELPTWSDSKCLSDFEAQGVPVDPLLPQHAG